MIDFGICCVAFGDEHIDEFNLLSQSLYNINPDIHIYVYTNNGSKIIDKRVYVTESNLKWNFNLKKESIKIALSKHDTILFMDTDMYVKKDLNFDILNDFIDDGLYLTRIPHKIFKYKEGETISIHNMIHKTKYGEYIKTLVNDYNDLVFTEEQFFILKLSNQDKKDKFYEIWDIIYQNTKDLNSHKDSIFEEGLNIYLACVLSDTTLHGIKTSMKILYNYFVHYGNDFKKIEKTIKII